MATDADEAAWMRWMGAPEAFVAHFEATGEIDGRLWPIRWPVQIIRKEAGDGEEHG